MLVEWFPGYPGSRRGLRLALALALGAPAAAQVAPVGALAVAQVSPVAVPAAAKVAPVGAPAAAKGLSAKDDDLLLFQLRLDRVILSENFPGYDLGEAIRVPLGELCRALDLAIQVDPAQGLATGFLVQESRPFRLDAKQGSVTVAGVTKGLDRARLELRADDIYVDTELLAQFLPLSFDVAKRAAVITVASREELPLQAAWKREGSASRLQPEAVPKPFSPLPDPYRWFEFPAVDASLTLGGSWPRAQTGQMTGSGSVLAAGDLLGLTTNLYAQAQLPGGLTEAHLAMGRRDLHGRLLGPLRATQFLFGEVLSPGLDLVAAPAGGTGFLVSNQPLQSGDAFDRHSFQGDLAPGWQVELYQNGTLVGFQASRADGRYVFLGLPLQFGWNEFRLAFYGPQGQRREEWVRFDVSANQTPVGAFRYHLVGLEGHRGTGRQGQLQLSYGLGKQLAATFGTALMQRNGSGRAFTQAGLQGFWKPLSGSLSLGRDGQGGTAAELALRTRLGAISVVGKQTVLAKGFQSDVFPQSSGAVRARTTLEVNAPLPGLERPWFTLDLGGHRDQLVTGGSADTLQLRVSSSPGGIFLANQLNGTVTRGTAQPVARSTSGEFLVSTVLPALALRGQASYTLTGARQLRALALTADLTSIERYQVQLGLTRSLRDRQTAVTLGLQKSQGAFSLGGNLTYSTQSRLSASLSLRLGLALEPRGRNLFSKAQGAASFGAVSAQAFLDANGNGLRDPGEAPVPEAAFQVNGAQHAHRTNAQGIVFLDGLPMDTDANIAVVTGTLEDPLMRAQRPGVRVSSRPGHVARLEVPIVLLSEITGTAYRVEHGRRTVLPGLRLELRDGQGKVVKSLRTAYDGFYAFTELPHGSYSLAVPEAAARQAGAAAPAGRQVQLAPEGTVLDGVDVLLELPEEATGPVATNPFGEYE